MSKKKPSEAVICRNKKAHHDYELLERFEAGLVLVGSEVKSLRAGKASIEESYARIEDDEAWLVGADIPIYAQANRQNHQPKRKRKLLLHRRELVKLHGFVTQRGFTLVPLRLYFDHGLAKVEIALARGRKTQDRREEIRKETARREIGRELRKRR
jgi:SsrA-binding protein